MIKWLMDKFYLPTTSVITHFYNEELLIGDWIKHHAPMFDYGILINHSSTDRSVEIARELLPANWKIVNTRLKDFSAEGTDLEVMEYEKQLPGWKMVLNITEFLFHPNLREVLKYLEDKYPDTEAFGSRAICLVDKEQTPIENPIWKNRTHGFLNFAPGVPVVVRLWRYIHKAPCGRYTLGRHTTPLKALNVPELLHLHLLFSPWPECLPRKLQIQTRIPLYDKQHQLGVQHITDEADLTKKWQDSLIFSRDLFEYEDYKNVYDEMINLYTINNKSMVK